MASSKNSKYEKAADNYSDILRDYAGTAGYNKSVEATGANAQNMYNRSVNAGLSTGTKMQEATNQLGTRQARSGNALAMSEAGRSNQFQNAEAKKYAKDQAAAAAAGTQAQATTAARTAGMNKAQAAMLGSQQNANAYQNAYGNAYSQQLGNAASNQNTQLSNYQNATNQANNNLLNQQAANLGSQQYQQSAALSAGNAAIGGAGTQLSAGQAEGQAEYDRTWGNWGNALGIGGSLLKSFSDENLKHYRECSKKVTYKSPSKIKSLKYVKETKGED